MEHIPHWIDGQPWTREAQRQGNVFDPSTGEVTAKVDFAGPAEVDAAVAAARRAFPAWRNTSLSARAKTLFAFRELLQANRGRLARIITEEEGKVLADADGEIARGLEVVEFACGLPQLLQGSFSANVSTSVDAYTFRQPLGVVAGITPFNFPAMVPMWMHPVAIACGNSFILKPSEKDPGASNLVAELWRDAGLPDGVFNVVHGDREAVDLVLQHPDIAAVSFVGSTPVARHVHASATHAGKRVQALGGAKNHMVVMPGADMELAADAAASAAYGAAALGPDRVQKLFAIGIPHPAALKPSLKKIWGVRHFAAYKLPGAPNRFARNDFAALPAIYRRWSPSWNPDPSEFDDVRASFSDPASLNAAFGYYRKLSPVPSASLKARIRVPTVVFAGLDDPIVAPSDYRFAARMFESEYTVEEVRGGHFMHREHPDVFAERLLTHL